MQPVEAITRVIALADGMTAPPGSPLREVLHTEEEQEQNTLAIGICQAMLNTALPVARFRCFVRIESGSNEGMEYTVCATKIEEVVCAIMPLVRGPYCNLYVSLWEQRATGADMVAGYQGRNRRGLGLAKRESELSGYLSQVLRRYATPAHAS